MRRRVSENQKAAISQSVNIHMLPLVTHTLIALCFQQLNNDIEIK